MILRGISAMLSHFYNKASPHKLPNYVTLRHGNGAEMGITSRHVVAPELALPAKVIITQRKYGVTLVTARGKVSPYKGVTQ